MKTLLLSHRQFYGAFFLNSHSYEYLKHDFLGFDFDLHKTSVFREITEAPTNAPQHRLFSS